MIHPDAPPAPKKPKSTVREPFFVAPLTAETKKDENKVKAREHYEKFRDKYGDLEAWHEKYAKQVRLRLNHDDNYRRWRKANQVEFWNGAVIDHEGRATKTSYRSRNQYANQFKAAAKKRREELAVERKRRLAAWKKANNSKDVKKILALLPADVREHFAEHMVTVNPDGTANMVKYVIVQDGKYVPGYGTSSFEYKIGEWVEDENFRRNPNCGNGLHFCATLEIAQQWVGRYGVPIMCKVDLRDIVLVHQKWHGKDHSKVKVKRAYMLGETDADGNLLPEFEDVVEKATPKKAGPKPHDGLAMPEQNQPQIAGDIQLPEPKHKI